MNSKTFLNRIRRLILDDSASHAVRILEGQFDDCDSHEQLALVCHQLAKIYCEQLDDTSGLAADYALLAGRSYLADRRVAPAVAILKFLGNCPNGHIQYKRLQTWIEEASPISAMRITKAPKKKLKAKPRLEDFPLFSDLSADQIRKLMKLCTVEELEPGTILFEEGDAPEAFYVVYEGEMLLESSLGLKKIFHEGDFFGELALLGNMKRTATLKTKTGASLLSFSERALKEAFNEWPEFPKKIFKFFNLRLFLNAAQRSPFFQSFTEDELVKCFSFFTAVVYPKGSAIILEGELAEAIYLIVRGECEVTKGRKVVATLGPGQFVGEVGLLRSAPRNASVVALKNNILMKASRRNFEKLTEEFPLLLKILKETADVRSLSSEEKFGHFRPTLLID